MLEFTVEDLSAEDIERLRAIYEPLAVSVRALVDATIRTEVDAETVAAVKADIDAATARLRSKQIDGAFGVKRTPSGRSISWGNAVIGLRNPTAPPLVIHRDEDDRRWADFHLGAAYEGPPGHVHGGVSALILDHVLGEAASPDAKPRFTGSITVRYLRACPLGPLHAEAQITRVDGVKTFVSGHISDAEGITVEAEGVFITPRWLRD
ncbi:PaaI family thioesterase [Mycolicibacterium aichiense]|uniref:Acyl-coenzyme A thioesterase THEM4 n=1 Tax=Mycolicibacterium aichiense TaxID=1799 RepID=A0AAD1MDB0_9MYCO|nr:PaaI family thioesterase [Mycolicibacterium aichiense]MCV7019584.1 PaaI family thioesterase [Mycolicibacterium aichiense]BBX08104.1 thioesterase [Mycolicibacterium aichiense]STZ81910.1 thioesterase superfamily protein [Mycolicibacterium aichiense]